MPVSVPLPPSMKTLCPALVCPALVCAAAFLAVSVGRADPIHSGSYTLTVTPGTQMSFSADGDYAGFGIGASPYHASNSAARFFPGYVWGNGWQAISETRSLHAELKADAGLIFDKVYIGFTPGSFENWAGGIYSESTWKVNGGTYAGDPSHFEGSEASYHKWETHGSDSGTATLYDGYWYHGVYETWGGFWGIPEYLTGFYDISDDTFSLDLSIYAVSYNDSSFEPPGFQFHFTYREAPPVGVPDSSSTLFGVTAGLGLMLGVRRHRTR